MYRIIGRQVLAFSYTTTIRDCIVPATVSPFQAMMDRRPANLLVESKLAQMTLNAWCVHLQAEANRVCDFVVMELSSLDFVDDVFEPPFPVEAKS